MSDAATPTDHGWDRHIGTLGGVLPDYYVWVGCRFGYRLTPVALDANVTSRSTPRCALHRDAAEWINRCRRPWFAMRSPQHAAHDPFQVPPGDTMAAAGNPADDDSPVQLDGAEHGRANIGRSIRDFAGPARRAALLPRRLPRISCRTRSLLLSSAAKRHSGRRIYWNRHIDRIYEGRLRVPG